MCAQHGSALTGAVVPRACLKFSPFCITVFVFNLFLCQKQLAGYGVKIDVGEIAVRRDADDLEKEPYVIG